MIVRKSATPAAHMAWGPLTVGGEFMYKVHRQFLYTASFLCCPTARCRRGRRASATCSTPGFYVEEALYFLTPGDHRPGESGHPLATTAFVRCITSAPSRTSPATTFGGLGAWEIGVRYDHMNVDSGQLNAGRLDSITVGLNWYLNPNLRVTLNYVRTYLDTGIPASSGNFDALGMRLHFDF